MLYNKDWDKKPKVPSLEDFIGWLETKNPEETYDYRDKTGMCCMGQYMADRNIDWVYAHGLGYSAVCKKMNPASPYHNGGRDFQAVLAGDCFGRGDEPVLTTFGATLERAKAFQKKERENA